MDIGNPPSHPLVEFWSECFFPVSSTARSLACSKLKVGSALIAKSTCSIRSAQISTRSIGETSRLARSCVISKADSLSSSFNFLIRKEFYSKTYIWSQISLLKRQLLPLIGQASSWRYQFKMILFGLVEHFHWIAVECDLHFGKRVAALEAVKDCMFWPVSRTKSKGAY